MLLDSKERLARMVDHCAQLGALPGWRPYLRQKVADLVAQEPEVYASLPELLNARLGLKSSEEPPSNGG